MVFVVYVLPKLSVVCVTQPHSIVSALFAAFVAFDSFSVVCVHGYSAGL